MKRVSFCFMIALLIAPLAFADPPPIDAANSESKGALSRTVADPATADPLDLTELGSLRAGDEKVVSAQTQQNLTALNSGNSVTADRVETGAVNLDAGAFAGYNGIGNFVINTGNNNNLQGAVSVTILMPPQ